MKLIRNILTITFLIGSLLLLSDSLFRLHSHLWDLDAFLYLGSRLAQGELLYFHDFETKLPFVQYLFWLPYNLGGIGAWRILTFIFCSVLVFLGSSILASKNNNDYCRSRYGWIFWFTGVFLFLLYDSPEANSANIEMLSAAFLYLSASLCISFYQSNQAQFLKIFIAGVSLGIATLIRPNYLFTLPAFLIVLLFLTSLCRLAIVLQCLIIFCAGFGSIMIACFSPYIFSEEGLYSLFSGINAIRHFPKSNQPIFFLTEFTDRSTSSKSFFLYGTLALAGLLILIGKLPIIRNLKSNLIKPYIFGIVFVVISLVGLKFSFFSTHYLPHYYSMYVPYIVLIAMMGNKFLIANGGIRLPHFSWFEKTLTYLIIALFIMMMLNPIRSTIHRIRFFIAHPQEFNLEINHRNTDPRLMQFLASLRPTLTWYVVNSATYHTSLNQPRIGDGHPEMLRYVASGIRVGPVNDIPLYSKQVAQRPCLALIKSNKDLIIFSKDTENYVDHFVPSCLAEKNSGYHELQPQEIKALILNGFDLSILSSYRIFMLK